MKLKAVIFDFDGPINDSFREGLRRIDVLAGQHGIELTREIRRKLTKLWGMPGEELLRQCLGLTKEEAHRMYKQWEVWDYKIPMPLVPGAIETLRWLRKYNVVNALLTSRNKNNIAEIFDKLDLFHEFKVISTRQDCQFKKPDPKVFGYVLEELKKMGIEKNQCIFVGDTPSDILAGQKANIKTVVVLTGSYSLAHIIDYPVKKENILPSIDYLTEWILNNPRITIDEG